VARAPLTMDELDEAIAAVEAPLAEVRAQQRAALDASRADKAKLA
jgi:hypothetical protein